MGTAAVVRYHARSTRTSSAANQTKACSVKPPPLVGKDLAVGETHVPSFMHTCRIPAYTWGGPRLRSSWIRCPTHPIHPDFFVSMYTSSPGRMTTYDLNAVHLMPFSGYFSTANPDMI